MDLPAGDVHGDVGNIGLAQFVRIHVIHAQAAAFRADEEAPAAAALMGLAIEEGARLASLRLRVAGGRQGLRLGRIDIQAAHRRQQDIPADGFLGKSADMSGRIHRDALVLQGGGVHDGQAARLAGQPHPAPGVLENGIDEGRRQISVDAVPAFRLQFVRVRIQDIDAVLGGGHPEFRRPDSRLDLHDGEDVLVGAGHFGVREVHRPERTAAAVELLQAHGRTRPQGSAAIFEDCQHQVAGQGVRLVPAVPEGLEIQSVKTGETVLRGDPHKASAILVDMVHLAIGKVRFGGIKPGHLRICNKKRQAKGYKNDRKALKMFQNRCY